MRRRAFCLLFSISFAAALTLTCAGVIASPADDAFVSAQIADREFRFGDAANAYASLLASDPSNAHAMQARARLDALRSHSEGEFAPLAKLERVRRDPLLARDAAAIAALAREADAFPPGLVRVEAWQLCADADAHRAHREDDAVRIANHVIIDPLADNVARTEAARIVVEIAVARGDFTLAREATSHDGVALDLRRDVARLARRRNFLYAAIGWLALFLVATLGAIASLRAPDRVHITRKKALLSAGIFGLMAAAGSVAGSYDGASPRPFLYLGGAVALISFASPFVTARVGAHRFLRGASIVLSALSVVAAAFVSLYVAGPSYLVDFGL